MTRLKICLISQYCVPECDTHRKKGVENEKRDQRAMRRKEGVHLVRETKRERKKERKGLKYQNSDEATNYFQFLFLSFQSHLILDFETLSLSFLHTFSVSMPSS